MTRLCETQNATIANQAKQLADQAELLKKRKKAKKGKRVRLEGVSIYTTADVLRVAREKEVMTATNKRRGPHKEIILIESSSAHEY